MRYGHFDDELREYVITRPDTPLPRINYLGGEELLRNHQQHGRRLLFLRDTRLRRCTPHRYNSVPTNAGALGGQPRQDKAMGRPSAPHWP